MKHFPSISHRIIWDEPIHAFDKLDGSNIRAEWSHKKTSFYKFGSRRRLIDAREPILGKSLDLIRDKYEKQLHDIFKEKRYESVICFFEFFGPSSFAGFHRDDEKHDVVLLDVAPYKRGIIPASEFIDTYGHLDIPKVVHVGPVDETFLHAVKDGKLPGMTFEGVVCKYASPDTGKIARHTSMFKVKNDAWLKKLKEHCGDDERKFEELK